MKIVIDIGAFNLGRLERRMNPKKKKYRGFKYICYDPCASVHEKRKPLVCDRLETHDVAVSDYNGSATLREPKHCSKGATMCEHNLEDYYNDGYIVNVVSCLSILEKYERVHTLMLNCEGSEIPILMNTPMGQLKKCKNIEVEFHVFMKFYNLDTVKKCLERLEPHFKIKCKDDFHPCYELKRK